LAKNAAPQRRSRRQAGKPSASSSARKRKTALGASDDSRCFSVRVSSVERSGLASAAVIVSYDSGSVSLMNASCCARAGEGREV